jgi:protein subunit release factor B
MKNEQISLKKEKDLNHKLRRVKIFKKDIKESFVLSSGPGGQKVNKSSSCVSLYHMPTGIRVKSRSTRSQRVNRYNAYAILMEKIIRQREEEATRKRQAAYKHRKNKSRLRSSQNKEKVLHEKHKLSEKKGLRKKIKLDSINKDL